MTCGARRSALLGLHSRPEVFPPLLGNLDLTLRDLGCVLAEHTQEDDEVPRAPVQDPVELRAVVATEFPQLAPNLRTVRERQVRIGGGE